MTGCVVISMKLFCNISKDSIHKRKPSLLRLNNYKPHTSPDRWARFISFQDLKEECVKLRTRVFDLEQQNRILSLLFQQRVKMSPTPVSQVTTHPACPRLGPPTWLAIGNSGFRRCCCFVFCASGLWSPDLPYCRFLSVAVRWQKLRTEMFLIL